jgi:hypothetical protein
MGLRESKIVLDALSEAYASAEQSRKNKIEVDLCQPVSHIIHTTSLGGTE